MKWYRIVDSCGEPYHSGYNETNLKELAYSIWSLGDGDGAWDDESFYGLTREEQIDKIYSLLKAGERDLFYLVEESDTPFRAEGYDCNFDGCDCYENFSDRGIISYATYNYGSEFNEDKLVDYIWGLGDINTDEFIKGVRDFFLNNNILKQGNFYYVN